MLCAGLLSSVSVKKRVLILCTGNSARSQMAEGLLRRDAGDRFEVESAGTKPSIVRPEAVAVMRELGIDIARSPSKSLMGSNSITSSPFATARANPARYSSRRRRNCTAISMIRRPSMGPKSNVSRCFGGCVTNCAVISAISQPQAHPIQSWANEISLRRVHLARDKKGCRR